MRKATIDEKKKCPKCGRIDGQIKNGRNRSGTQTCLCNHCKKTYTLAPKSHAYVRKLALKIYYAGAGGRGVGKVLGMNELPRGRDRGVSVQYLFAKTVAERRGADLRHYIPVLARKSRCFARKIETLYAVMEVFVSAYNRFGAEKYKYRQIRKTGEVPFSVLDFL